MLLKVQPNPEVIKHVSIFPTLAHLSCCLSAPSHLCSTTICAKERKKNELLVVVGVGVGVGGSLQQFQFASTVSCAQSFAGNCRSFENVRAQYRCMTQVYFAKSEESFISFCNLHLLGRYLAPSLRLAVSQTVTEHFLHQRAL